MAEDEQFLTKSMANNVIKLTCSTSDMYRNIVKHVKENGIFFHTYQLKEGRAFRAVLKDLHHSTDVQEIRQELLEMGHVARNIVNAHHRETKEPLNLFFVDLEPADNNKDIYNITALQNKIINTETPRLNKNTSHNVSDANSTGTPEHTAINLTRVSNAEGPTAVQIALSKRTRQEMCPVWREPPGKLQRL